MTILERKLWKRTILNVTNQKTYHSGKETLKKDNSEQETSEKKTILERKTLENDHSGQEHLENDNSGKEHFEQGQFWTGRI